MKRVAILCSLLLPCLARAEVSVQGKPEEARAFLQKDEARVTLHGQAATAVEASEAHAIVECSGEGSSYSAAVDTLEKNQQKLLGRLEGIGIPRGQVKVPKFATVEPKHASSGGQVISYQASSSLVFLVHEQKQYLDLLTLLDQTREAKLADLTYNHPLLTELHKQILAGACKSVMTRKEAYEQNLGVTLRPISFTEDEGSERPARFERANFGQIPIKAGIRVVFEVIPGAPAAPKKPVPAASPSPSVEP